MRVAALLSRRYAYIVLESPVRPSLESAVSGWVYRSLDEPSHAQRLLSIYWANTIFLPSGPAVAKPCRPSKP